MFSPWSEVGDLTGVGGDVDISVDSLSITLAPFLSVCRIHNFLRNFLAYFAHQCQSILTSHCHCFSTPSKEYLKLTHLLLEDQIWSLSFLYFAQFALFFFDVNFELLPISVSLHSVNMCITYTECKDFSVYLSADHMSCMRRWGFKAEKWVWFNKLATLRRSARL